MTRSAFSVRLDDPRPLRLDGALGTCLESGGPSIGTALWSARALLDEPDRVASVHRAYATAGVEVHTANTFRTRQRDLARSPRTAPDAATGARTLTQRAVELARAACDASAGAPGFVFGSHGPAEDCYLPELAPDDRSLEREHREHAAILCEAGCDGILVETHNSVREGRIATAAAAATGLPVWSSFVCGPGARLLSGEPLSLALSSAADAGATALGVNCLALDHCDAALEALLVAGYPFGFAPNLSFDPSLSLGGGDPPTFPDTARFAAATRRWRDAGARYLGACCGSRPEDLAALRFLKDAPKSASR